MNIKDISITKAMTINLGNYSSHRVEVGFTASFDPDDDIDHGVDQLTTMVNKKLSKEVTEFTANHKTTKKRQALMEDHSEEDHSEELQ